MGYVTRFGFGVLSGPPNYPLCEHPVDLGDKYCKECGKPVKLIEPYEKIMTILYEKTGLPFGYFISVDRIKWYSHEEDMIFVSKILKHSLLFLKGYGEEPEDIWIKYFLNGKIQREKAEIIFPMFDEKKLTRVDSGSRV